MNLTHRLTKLEHQATAAGDCPHCQGRGVPDFQVIDGNNGPVEPKGCPHCGRVSSEAGFHIVIGEPGQ